MSHPFLFDYLRKRVTSEVTAALSWRKWTIKIRNPFSKVRKSKLSRLNQPDASEHRKLDFVVNPANAESKWKPPVLIIHRFGNS